MNLNEFADARILIVDDEPANLRVLYNLLRPYPLRLFTVQNSLSVPEFLEKELPDLILLDIMMPGMNGFELCQKIKESEKTSHISVIFISALNDTANIVKGFELGAVDYITKPFQSEEVLARIRNQLMIQFQAKRLEEKNRELTELNSMKNKFFSVIAHDVRNPFAAILGITEELYADFEILDPAKIRELTEHLYVSSRRCYQLLDNLLKWANSQLNRISIQPGIYNVQEHITEIAAVFQSQAESKKIRILTQLDPSLHYFADKNLIEAVLRNLINNAVKFTPENGTVRITARSTEGGMVEIRVADTGIGMPEEIRAGLFRPGSKVKRPGTAREDGTGLGLILSHEFLLKSGGSIRAESEPGKGSEFIVALPGPPVTAGTGEPS